MTLENEHLVCQSGICNVFVLILMPGFIYPNLNEIHSTLKLKKNEHSHIHTYKEGRNKKKEHFIICCFSTFRIITDFKYFAPDV